MTILEAVRAGKIPEVVAEAAEDEAGQDGEEAEEDPEPDGEQRVPHAGVPSRCDAT